MEKTTLDTNLANPDVLIPAIRSEWTTRYKKDTLHQWHPAKHNVMDQVKRCDKTIMQPVDPENPNGSKHAIQVQVSRITVPVQKLIVRRAVAFITGGSVSLSCKPGNEGEESLLQAVNDAWRAAKVDFKNSELVRRLLSETEACEIWYSRTEANGKISLRCKVYSPALGYELLPVFDATGDMIAFGLAYTSKGADKTEIRHFDLYTADTLRRFQHGNTGVWTASEPVKLGYGKIPVIYYQVEEPIWSDVQTMIDRLEIVLSNFADTNDYNGSPILFAEGSIQGFADKGETGKVVEGEPGSKLSYVTWAQVPEAIKFEVEMLLRMIYSGVQVPDISFEAMRALGALSGVAFDRLMIDAHLRAKEYQDGIYGEGVQRRINFLVSACAAITKGIPEQATGLEITPKFGLFSIHDDAERIGNAMKANGNKPVMTQRESVAYLGISDDTDATADALEAEAAEAAERELKTNPSSELGVGSL